MPAKSLSVLVITAALASGITATAAEKPQDTVRVIVELTGASVARTEIAQEFKVVHQLSNAFDGLVVEVPGSSVDSLATMPGVKAVHPDTTYTINLDDSVPLVGAPEVWKSTDPEGRPADGTGTIVAVLDTGLDYHHPDLAQRVVGGYDFVNGDADPMDDNGHGTHVAGIVAASGRVKGVAPGARLTAYKVVDRYGSARLSDIMAGIDAAIAQGNEFRADVLNLSLSGPGDGTDPLAQAAERAAAAGVVVVASAGNAGPGPQTVRSPAAAPRVLAVGASVSGVTVPRITMVDPAREDLHAVRRSYSAPAKPVRAEVVDIGQGTPVDYEGKDVAGKALLCHAYLAAEDEMELSAYAEERGAVAIFFFVPDTWGPPQSQAFVAGKPDDGRLTKIVATQIPGASAATLIRHLSAGTVRVDIAAVDATDQLADFSSRGPSGRFLAKPELIASGVEILSTLPGGGHGRLSGTSMAAPHVAGAAALVRQLHPDWTGAQVSSALVTSTRRSTGRLDVPAAARTRVLASPHTVSFGLADLTRSRIERAATIRLTGSGTAALGVERSGGLPASVRLDHKTARLPESVTLRISLDTPRTDGDVAGWVTVDLDRNGSIDARIPFLLAVRHLTVHTTPDPAPERSQASVFVRSPVDEPVPAVEVRCPGLNRQQPVLQPAGTRIWRATVNTRHDGICQVTARAGGLTGDGAFEVTEPPRDGAWESIGPNAEAGWLSFGAHGNRMAVVPLGSAGIFVSDNRGQSWRELRTMPVGGGQAVSVVPHPRDGLYVATNGNGGQADRSYRGRILRTDDSGTTWSTVNGRDAAITDIAFDATGNNLAVADEIGLRVTRDGGASWTDLPKSWSLLFDVSWIGPDLYAATTSGLLVIRNAAGPDPTGPEVLFKPSPLGWASRVTGDAGLILVGSYPSAWLYASTDGGATFKQVLQKTGTSFQDLELVGDDIYALQGSGHLWVGSDRGASWTSWGDPLGNAVEFDVARSPDGVHIASSGAGVYRATEPGGYRRIGVPAAQVRDLAISRSALIAGTTRDTFRTLTPDNPEWQSSGGEGLAGAEAQFVSAAGNVVYKTRGGRGVTFGIYRSTDGGATWTLKASPSEKPTSLLVHPADPNRIYAGYWSLTGIGLVQSLDGGETWRKIHQPNVFRALAGDPEDPDRIWAGDETGLYRSDDGGVSFTRLSTVPVTAIAVDPDDSRLVVGGRGLFTSRDGGRTLRPAHHTSLDLWITDLLFASGRVYAASGSFYDELGLLRSGRGVLRSDDGGSHWKSISGGLANTNVTSLAAGRYLYAGTSGGSVYRLTHGPRDDRSPR